MLGWIQNATVIGMTLMTLDPAYAKLIVSRLKDIDEPLDFAIEADKALSFLLKQLEELRDLANGYPRNPIQGIVWKDGAALTDICDELTDILDERNQAERQELASRLAGGMACQIMGHYPEQIFPRVLRNAHCREAIHQYEDAIGSYMAIVQDFSIIGLDKMLDEVEPLDEAERCILAAVREALERLQALQSQSNEEYQDLLRKIDVRLGTANL
jgi:hypothetical protein